MPLEFTKGKAFMENADYGTQHLGEDAVSPRGGIARTANKAVRDSAQKYLNAAGINVDLGNLEQRIHSRPLLSVGLAAGAGFAFGGG